MPAGGHGTADGAAFAHLWRWCDETGLPPTEIAAATVFRTGEFVSEMRALRDECARLSGSSPTSIRILADYPTYYVVEGSVTLPIWQDGDRPYWTGGGKIHFVDGRPVRQWDEEVRFAVSVPKEKMPEAGFPLLFYSNGQGGSYTQVFDRKGIEDEEEVPGEGPGLQFAARGIACLDLEAPTVGPRHPTGSTSGLAFPNFWNLVAFRDNIRQAASEFTVLLEMARNLRLPASLVPETETGGGEVRYDPSRFAFWGHSTGAGIGELVLAVEPGFRAGMVSGAGVSWAYNLVLKQEPLPFRLLAQLLSGEDEVDEFHPLPLLFQSVADPSEAAYFAWHWIREPLAGGPPPDILVLMGIVDLYFPPPMNDGLVVAAGLDVAGPLAHEGTREALALSRRSLLALPASGNLDLGGGKIRTGVAVQFETPEGVDGHYAPFVLPEAKHAYTCFFESFATAGLATVPRPVADPFGPCGVD